MLITCLDCRKEGDLQEFMVWIDNFPNGNSHFELECPKCKSHNLKAVNNRGELSK